MAEAGLQFVAQVQVPGWEADPAFEVATEILMNHQVTAVLCANDRIAFGVYQAAAQQGMVIPRDLSVMSFDDEQMAGYVTPGLTSMQFPYEDMGRFATQWVLNQPCPVTGNGMPDVIDRSAVSFAKYGEPDKEIKEVRIRMPLVERGSVARPAGGLASLG